MRNRTIILVVIAVVVIAGSAWWLIYRAGRPADRSTVVNQNRNAAQAQFDKDLDAFARADWRGDLDDRVELIGGSLVNVPENVMSGRIAAVTKRTVHVNFTDGMTTRQAISALSTMLGNRPPKTIVLDVGRYDSSNGIGTQETAGNIAAILLKSEDIGIRVVVIGGIGSDGNVDFASVVRPVVTEPSVFIDASAMMQNPELRTSPVELNEAGAAMLAEQVSAIVAKQ